MFRKHGGQLFSRTPYSVFHTDRPSNAKHSILSAEEEELAQLRALLCLISGDMGDHPLMTALPSGAARTRPKLTATPIANGRQIYRGLPSLLLAKFIY
jgi:hypothetical protein